MSLPILLGMMLLAYRTYADIPDRMTVFYSQAFETLYSIHDAENKELFKRKHHAGLAPDVFKSVLQAFCYLSLSNHDIEFSEDTLGSYTRRALKISGVDVSYDKFKNDLIHNVCIIQPDGLSYVFVHRSFQEYFAALFAINYSGEKKFEVFDQIVNVSGSAVAQMMMEIDPIKSKRLWLLPKMTNFSKYLSTVMRRKLVNRISAFCHIIWDNSEDPDMGRLSYTLGPEGDNNYRLVELMNDLTSENLGFARIVDSLKIPPEDTLIEEVQPVAGHIRPGTGALHPGICYGRRNTYPFSRMSESRLQSIGILQNIVAYRETLSRVLADLNAEVEGRRTLEDHELFD